MPLETLSAPSLYVENSIPTFSREAPFANVLMDLQTQGWSVQDQFFSDEFTQALMDEVHGIDHANMQQAGIGRKQDHQVMLDARRDYIQWIDPDRPIRRDFLKVMEELRVALNRRLFLGLFDYEAHFARYEKGAFYEKHLDAFQGRSNRVLSTVLYLNDDWQDQDGGEFVLYDERETDNVLGRFYPQRGRLAIFLSEAFPHEVLAANRTRHSIAGWFRINNSTGQIVDPDQ
ncbi:2OG-Fe(II) oxygenase [Marinomonas posidonica]|uniref:2OG-Fe(II) oxygenase n=1 Tax=Marinomonas posidonica (strain CECT 7376 / NCIMB 14433 / IVIA-Po-181) TaxID=491952 RepID=F6CYF2_MARPP|nr:2OG-Fe(II) oxygenase [Marinomonas posidonica]AEF54561.1 2OG-Fe(II) oxygenase [Marinomonas posidonica IVIA-Po-181]